MQKFNPKNVKEIGLTATVEGWTVICSALERRLFENDYEEGKLVHSAGIVHAMLSGLLMKQLAGQPMDEAAVLRFFSPSINFFENVLAIADWSDRRVELAPFANFELFGMWSSLGLASREVDSKKMESMVTESARRYGTPAIVDLIELIVTKNPNVDQSACLNNLQQWLQSVITIQTQKLANFPEAEEVVLLIGECANNANSDGSSDATIANGLLFLAVFARLLYDSAVDAHAQVCQQTGLPVIISTCL
jgi:hypothetical protein